MRSHRSVVAGLLAGGLALSLVAAEAAPTTPAAGTASTSLFGAEVSVTMPGLPAVDATVLELESFASTAGTPSALTSIVPIEANGTPIGATGASSSGSASGSSDGGSFGDLAGTLGVVVSPIETSASATAERAEATISAATAQLGAVLGALGLDLDTTAVTSLVNADGATATQGLTVTGLDLGLADLGLGADVLGLLDLASLLELFAALPGILPADLEGAPDVLASLESLDAALATFGTAGAPVVALVDDIATQVAALTAQVDELSALLATLQGLNLGDPVALLATLTGDAALLTALDDAGCGLGTLDVLTVVAAVQGAITCLTTEIASLTTAIDDLVALLPADLGPVLDQVQVVLDLIDQILAQLGDLEGILGLLPDLLANASGLSLLEVGAFNVGTTAIAGSTAADSSASVLCDPVTVTVLGESFSTPDCSDALDQLSGVTGAITGAVDQLTGVLNALPLVDAVSIGEFRADLFTDVVEEVTETDGVVTSRAGFNLLDLAIPSVTLDPSQVVDGLGDLGLPDVVTPVTDVLTDLVDDLAVLDGLGVADAGTLLTPVNDALTAVGAPDGLSDLVDQVAQLLAALDLSNLDLGSLVDEISTPAVELVIDPVATAEFQAAASGGSPTPAPTPAPTPEPTLPVTGGGLGLLAVLSLAGAAGLRRRNG